MNSQPFIASQQTPLLKILDHLSASSGTAGVLVLSRRQVVASLLVKTGCGRSLTMPSGPICRYRT